MNSQKILILFGTQTGNSEDVAERIGRVLTRMHFKSVVQNIEDYLVTKLVEEQLIIFVCSTTGNGEFPDNMKNFWRFLLRKNLPSDSLSDLHFCVFGLGDSSYDKYNVVAKKLNKRLLQLGATELLPLTLGDDQHELSYDAAFDPWLLKLKDAVSSFYNIKEKYIDEDLIIPPKYSVKFLTDVENEELTEMPLKQTYQLATLKSIKRETSADHFQAVYLVKFNIDPTVAYEAGDVAVVWPENPQIEVEEFLSLLKVPLDTKFLLIPSNPHIPPPKMTPYPCTVRECSKKYFDIMSIPKRSFFEFFYYFSQDETEKEKLLEFITPEGQEELFSYCNRPRRTILEVLHDFPHTTPFIPFQYFFDMIPAIRPRSYSIASSVVVHPCEFHLLVAVVKYRTRLQKPRRGLCSNWITGLQDGIKIPFYTKKGSITLPKLANPIIMIGPGTGCAPFRAFVEYRASKLIGENYLFFGCRYQSKDFLCYETWEDLMKKNMLTLFTAFSRDQEDKIYVQHKIMENSKLIWDLVNNQEAYIFVAGNAKQMPQCVKEAFLTVFNEHKLDHEESLQYIQNLENAKRYLVETWA